MRKDKRERSTKPTGACSTVLGTRKARAPGYPISPLASPKLNCRGQGESCRHLDKPALVEGVIGNHPESQSACMQGNGRSRHGSQSCGNNGCFLRLRLRGGLDPSSPKAASYPSNKPAGDTAHPSSGGSCACCGLCWALCVSTIVWHPDSSRAEPNGGRNLRA